jgi:hypothetical protein
VRYDGRHAPCTMIHDACCVLLLYCNFKYYSPTMRSESGSPPPPPPPPPMAVASNELGAQRPAQVAEHGNSNENGVSYCNLKSRLDQCRSGLESEL